MQLNLQGSAGQSFACFLVAGMVVRLVGEANDGVGKVRRRCLASHLLPSVCNALHQLFSGPSA